MKSFWDLFIRTGSWIEEDRFDLIQSTPLFEGLNTYDYRQMADLFHESKYDKGERIFTEGDPASAMYLIEEGAVRLFRENGNEEEFDVAIINQGAFFGELALASDHRRTASAVCEEKSVLLGLFKQELEEFILRESDTGVKILMNLVDIVSRRLNETNEEIEELKRKMEELTSSNEPG